MEKKKATYELKAAKALMLAGQFRITKTAATGGREAEFGPEDIREVVLGLDSGEFYKSMTTDADHRVWQDVYLPVRRAIPLYVKIQITDELVIISFKRK